MASNNLTELIFPIEPPTLSIVSAAKMQKDVAARPDVFSQSSSPDWEKENSLCELSASNEWSEWVVNIMLKSFRR